MSEKLIHDTEKRVKFCRMKSINPETGKRYTQEQIAGLLYMSKENYCRIEAGKIGYDRGRAMEISEILGCCLEYLLYEDDIPFLDVNKFMDITKLPDFRQAAINTVEQMQQKLIKIEYFRNEIIGVSVGIPRNHIGVQLKDIESGRIITVSNRQYEIIMENAKKAARQSFIDSFNLLSME